MRIGEGTVNPDRTQTPDGWTAWRTRHRWITRSVLGLSVVILSLQAASPWVEVRLRGSESEPHTRLFLVWRTRIPQRGDLVAFRMTSKLAGPYASRPWAAVGALWTKRLVGLPGDRVTQDGTVIRINGTPVGEVQPTDSAGRPMYPVSLVDPIPAGQVYVALPHPRSFDSRYWGYLPQSAIVGTVTPLW